jgi:nucleotide-binding universal stress UspA family protein
MFKTILFPIDRSPESREAADMVAKVAKEHSSKLVLLSVVESPEAGETPKTIANQEMTSPQAIAELLSTAKSLFSNLGIEAEVIEREGKPAFTICDVADEIAADLIIMGCRGLGLTDEGIQDSVTNRVINLSPCPILIVP